MLGLKVLEVSSESLRILDETCFEGSPQNTHTHTHAFSIESGTSGGKKPNFSDHCLTTSRTMTNPSGPGYSLMVSPIIIFKQVWMAQAKALALQSCLEEGPPWVSPVPSQCSAYRLLHGSVACSYCAGLCLLWLCRGPVWIHASWWGHGDTVLRAGC